jgi:hypothetical protein
MEPVRVKMYGLFSLTKRRYLTQAVVGVVVVVLALVGWWFASPFIRGPLARPDLPPSVAATAVTYVAVWDSVPWILLAALAFKAVEVAVVLRIFGRKEASTGAAAKTPGPG